MIKIEVDLGIPKVAFFVGVVILRTPESTISVTSEGSYCQLFSHFTYKKILLSSNLLSYNYYLLNISIGHLIPIIYC